MRQIDHVICPVDLSPCSERALAYAFAWARWYGAEVHVLHVLHVVPMPLAAAGVPGVVVTLGQKPLAEVRREVEDHVSSVPNPGVALDVQVFEGDPASIILREVKRYHNAVLIIGSHARRGLERFVLGSVAERIIHDTAVATLIVPPPGGHEADAPPVFKRILCAVDLLPSSLEGLRYALSLAKESDATVDIVHVVEDATADLLFSPHLYAVPEYQRYRVADALREIQQHVPNEAREACSVREEVLTGDAVSTLLGVAEETRAELIVVGAGDRYHLRSLWLGSTTHRIVRAAHCPVLVVPTPAAVWRAAAVTAAPLARELWRDELERVSREHHGDRTTVTVIDEELSAQPEATALPLLGVMTEGDATGVEAIDVMLGAPDGTHLTHVIPHPSALQLHETRLHAAVSLLVRSQDGTVTLIEVARQSHPRVEALAQARIQL